MSDIEILRQFKNTLISFLDELIEQFPSEADLVIFRIFVKDKIETSKLISYFVLNILPFKDMVANRDENYFLNHYTLLDCQENLDAKTKVQRFKKLWLSPSLDDDDKDIVWKWFDTFIVLGEKYQKVVSKSND